MATSLRRQHKWSRVHSQMEGAFLSAQCWGEAGLHAVRHEPSSFLYQDSPVLTPCWRGARIWTGLKHEVGLFPAPHGLTVAWA